MPVPTANRDPESVRPALWVAAALVMGMAALFSGMALDSALSARSGGTVVPEAGGLAARGGRRIVLESDGAADGRVRDHGGPSRIRESFREAVGEGGVLAPPQAVDPQLAAYRRSFQTEEGAPFTPTARRGRLSTVRGLSLAPGATCDVRVLPVADSSFNCLVRVMCGGVVVYPNDAQTAGYVACELDGRAPRGAVDSMPTERDGDPAVALDLSHGRVLVSDGDPAHARFEVSIDLDSTPARVL